MPILNEYLPIVGEIVSQQLTVSLASSFATYDLNYCLVCRIIFIVCPFVLECMYSNINKYRYLFFSPFSCIPFRVTCIQRSVTGSGCQRGWRSRRACPRRRGRVRVTSQRGNSAGNFASWPLRLRETIHIVYN